MYHVWRCTKWTMVKKSYEGVAVDLFKAHWTWFLFQSLECVCVLSVHGLVLSWSVTHAPEGVWRCEMAFGDVEGKQLEEALQNRAKGKTQQFPFSTLASGSWYVIFLHLTAWDETAVSGSILLKSKCHLSSVSAASYAAARFRQNLGCCTMLHCFTVSVNPLMHSTAPDWEQLI